MLFNSNDIGIALICISALLLISVYVYYPDSSDQDFIRFSILFLISFYILPALICAFQRDFTYLGKRYHEYLGVWLLIGLSLCFFILGFFLKDIIVATKLVKHSTSIKSGIHLLAPRVDDISINRAAFLIVFAAIFRIISWHLNPSVQEEYEIRAGILTGNHLTVLINITTGGIYFAAIFIADHLRWRYCTLALLFGLMILTFWASSGRFNAAVAICIFVIYFFKINISKITLLAPIFVIMIFPIILSGKFLIFAIATGIEIPDLSEILQSSINIDSYLNNFGHPMVSLFQIDALLNLSDFRWFYDFLQGPLFYFRIFGYDTGPSLSYYNTEAFLGFKSSIIPTGYLAFGYAQMSYFGVFIMGILYRYLYYMFKNLRYIRLVSSPLLSFYISTLSANTFYIGEIRTLIMQFFINILILYICFWFVSRESLLNT